MEKRKRNLGKQRSFDGSLGNSEKRKKEGIRDTSE
jgi:hypothetical protein